jgi:tRNA (mo5U34)-methyltransferase
MTNEVAKETERDQLLTVPLKHERRFRLGGFEIGVSMDVERAERLRNSSAFRYALRPAINGLGKLRGNGHGTSNGHHPGEPAAPVRPAEVTPEARAILDRIATTEWYHTIELPHGVVTPGYVDHREQLPHYNLPNDMRGMRVLDVATFDGFWAFEFERRGAEVVAVDIGSVRDTDVPRNWREEFEAKLATSDGFIEFGRASGFQIAHEILESRVDKRLCSVYDVSPERLGMFDMVFCSDLLIHLRDPLAAMEAIWTVTKNVAVFADVYHPQLDAFEGNALTEFTYAGQGNVWWRPSVTCYRLWLRLARFSRVDEISRFVLESQFRSEIPKVVFHAYR